MTAALDARGLVLCPGPSAIRPRPEAGALPGDKGAAAFTGFRLLSGFHQPTLGAIQMDGAAIALRSPRDAAAHGIATVQGFGGTFPFMSIGRSFSSGSGRQGAGVPSGCPIASGPKKSSSRLRRISASFASTTATVRRPVRGRAAIARAVHCSPVTDEADLRSVGKTRSPKVFGAAPNGHAPCHAKTCRDFPAECARRQAQRVVAVRKLRADVVSATHPPPQRNVAMDEAEYQIIKADLAL